MAECKDIDIRVYDGDKNKVVSMPLEDLAAEILASQMPAEFNMEALKAQSLLIRTNIMRQSFMYDGGGCRSHPGADICNTGDCMEWSSRERLKKIWADRYDDNWDRISGAVEATRGETVTVAGKLIKALYHPCCGGATENSEDITGNRIVYMRKVLCKYCKESAYWENVKDMTVQDMEDKLGVKISRANPVKGSPIEGLIDEIERDPEGRIRRLRIGGKYFSGSEIKDLLGLNSTRFGWNPVMLRFYTGGKGHGLGMCQYGADAMAARGSGYREIIEYYFTGVGIMPLREPDGQRPLKGKVFVLDPGHGGDSRDYRGPEGLREKDVNLDIAKKLSELLRGAGAEVHLTREDDTDVLLSTRAEMANSLRPHFFISIHQNGFHNPGVSGTEIYHYDGDAEGAKLGRAIMSRLEEDLNVINKGIKTANFYILREVKVKAVLLELFYITNPEEERKLRSEEFKSASAKAVFEGIMRYYRR